MSCSLNLASCRLRAESLARQLHSSLWLPRSPGDSGSVSPCFGLPPSALLVVDRQPPPANGHLPLAAMDSVDSDLCSPPYSPLETEGLMPKTSPGGLFGRSKEENHVWRPDSPPESFASESEAPSDSPALTIETDETPNSVETVSELASPTDEYQVGEESPLADELRTRLRLIQTSLSESSLLGSPTDEEDTASTLSSSVHLLSPPELPRLVRSTSLKTGKTPPDTPSRKKIVRFADVLGLDLEAVRHFAKDDDAPVVPPSAFADLQVAPPALSSLSSLVPPQSQSGFRLDPEFTPPGTDPFFLDRVRQQKVCLEDVVLSGTRVSGVVRVLNLGFEKQVRVRYTTNEWASHADLPAEYVPSSCDGFSDKFSFSLDLPHLTAGQRMHFCVRYIANGQEFWDNNCGQNYVLRCRPASPEREDEEAATTRSWLHHFM